MNECSVLTCVFVFMHMLDVLLQSYRQMCSYLFAHKIMYECVNKCMCLYVHLCMQVCMCACLRACMNAAASIWFEIWGSLTPKFPLGKLFYFSSKVTTFERRLLTVHDYMMTYKNNISRPFHDSPKSGGRDPQPPRIDAYA